MTPERDPAVYIPALEAERGRLQADLAAREQQLAKSEADRIALLKQVAELDQDRAYFKNFGDQFAKVKAELDNARRELVAHREKAQGNYWAWQGDGDDHLESLVGSCPVTIMKPHAQSNDLNPEQLKRKRIPYSKYSESRWGDGNNLMDDVARQLNGYNRCCLKCGASTSLRLLKDGVCPDCDGRAKAVMGSEYADPFLT